MSSILKVDQIQLANGNTPTAGDLGINDTGTVLQVVTATNPATGFFTTSSTSYVTHATNAPSATITPKATNSKILIQYTIGMQHDGTGQILNSIFRAISGGATTNLAANTYGLSFKGTTNQSWSETSINWVDSPNTTSAVTYTWYSKAETAVSISPTHTGSTWTATLIEIAG